MFEYLVTAVNIDTHVITNAVISGMEYFLWKSNGNFTHNGSHKKNKMYAFLWDTFITPMFYQLFSTSQKIAQRR